MLNRSEILDLLKIGEVKFVVADVGKMLQWGDAQDRFGFWRAEARPILSSLTRESGLMSFQGPIAIQHLNGGASSEVLLSCLSDITRAFQQVATNR